MAAHRAGALADQLQYALDYRVIIERAVGYLMASRQLDATAAFDLLRRTARSNRRTVADLAHTCSPTGPSRRNSTADTGPPGAPPAARDLT